jgi:hypothetical protein
MSKTMRFYIAVISCLFVTACGTYYTRISYVPDENDKKWIDGVYTCAAGKIQTNGVTHEPKKFESIFGVPIPYNYSKQDPLVWLAFDSSILKNKECNLGLVQLEDKNGESISPVSVYSNLSSNYSGYDAFCFYRLQKNILTKSSYTLKFNQSYANCAIPSLQVSKTEESGYRFEQVQ